MADQCDLGNILGHHVSDYALVFADGSEAVTPVLRRFAIQQRHIDWGASAFEAVPATAPYSDYRRHRGLLAANGWRE